MAPFREVENGVVSAAYNDTWMTSEDLGKVDDLTANDSLFIAAISPCVETATNTSGSSGQAYRPYAL